jgi:hypothetical protein
VRIARTTRISWRHLLRRWRATRRHLLRKRATLTLLVLLTLGLGEPLLCIIHCQIWLPLTFHSYFAAQHPHAHHHDHAHMTAAPTEQPAQQPAGAVITSPAPSEHTMCAFQGGSGQGSVPFHVPPSPIHDMIPALVLLLLLPLVVAAWSTAPPGDPPPVFHAPPLRPPIAFAA